MSFWSIVCCINQLRFRRCSNWFPSLLYATTYNQEACLKLRSVMLCAHDPTRVQYYRHTVVDAGRSNQTAIIYIPALSASSFNVAMYVTAVCYLRSYVTTRTLDRWLVIITCVRHQSNRRQRAASIWRLNYAESQCKATGVNFHSSLWSYRSVAKYANYIHSCRPIDFFLRYILTAVASTWLNIKLDNDLTRNLYS